jgi:hypothetical protein
LWCQVGYESRVRPRHDDLVVALNADTQQILLYEVRDRLSLFLSRFLCVSVSLSLPPLSPLSLSLSLFFVCLSVWLSFSLLLA